jgi:hypothetical protein
LTLAIFAEISPSKFPSGRFPARRFHFENEAAWACGHAPIFIGGKLIS